MKGKHEPIEMIKEEHYTIDDRLAEMHRWRCMCECESTVINLMGDKRVWTRVQFDCGEQVKVNCKCLTEL